MPLERSFVFLSVRQEGWWRFSEVVESVIHKEREKLMDLNRTFVTSDHHFRYWKHPFHLHCESTEEEEREHITLWNSIVGKDDLVFYVGDFFEGA